MANKVLLYFILSTICYIMAFVSPTVVFVWSAFQIGSTEKTANGTTILNGAMTIENPCSRIDAFVKHRPCRFFLNHDPGSLGCGWGQVAVGARMAIAAAAAIVSVASLIITFVKRSKLTYLVWIVLVAGGVGFSWLLIKDAKATSASSSWCNSGMAGVPFVKAPTKIECSYWPFGMVCFFDSLGAVSWFALSAFSVLYLCNAGPRQPGESHRIATGVEEQQPDSAFVPTSDSDAKPTTPLVGKKQAEPAGFNFESGSSSRSPEPPAFAPAPAHAAPASAASKPLPRAPTAQAPAAAKPPTAPPPSSGGFDFEAASKAAPSGDLDFGSLGTKTR